MYDRDPYVSWVHVKSDLQRCHLATRLYERLAADVCATYRKPLASDTERSAPSEAFWMKQVAKGRASCVETSDERRLNPASADIIVGRGGCLYYQLKSCAVRDLSAARKRKR